jgi:hypothetical protein
MKKVGWSLELYRQVIDEEETAVLFCLYIFDTKILDLIEKVYNLYLDQQSIIY